MAKRRFKPVQLEKSNAPKLRFSLKFILWVWIIIILGFFVTYLILSNFTDAFITGEKSELIAQTDDLAAVNQNESSTIAPGNNGVINPVPENENKQGSTYFSNCLFVGDSILTGLSESGVNSKKISAGKSYILSNIADAGLTVNESNLYLMLGFTEIESGEISIQNMITKYDDVLRSIKSTSPTTEIYVMAIPPVPQNNVGTTNASIDDYNSALLQLCNSEGVNYIDTNTDFKDNAGNLAENYYEESEDPNLDFSASAYNTLADIILSHTR